MTSYHYRDPDAPALDQPRRVTVIAIIEHRGEVLFDRRADGPFWGLIGGRLQDDESLLDGLRREVREETGLDVRRVALFGTFSDPSRRVRYADGGGVCPIVSLAYRVEVEDPAKLRVSEESRELRFFPKDGFPTDVIATHRPVIERYLSGDEPPFLD